MNQIFLTGNGYVEFVDAEGNNNYPIATVGDIAESYYTEKELSGTKVVEPKVWFFQGFNFDTRKRENSELLSVSKINHNGKIIYLSGKIYNKKIGIIGDPDITVRNILSKKVLKVPLRLVVKWKDMYQIAVLDNNRIKFDTLIIEEDTYNGLVYSLISKNNQINVNNIIL